MRFIGVALLGLMVSCGGGTAPVTPPAPPPPGTLYGLVSSPKNIKTGTFASKPDELWVAKGGSVTLVLTGENKSPGATRIQVLVSGSDGVTVTPLTTFIEGNESKTFTVSVPSNFTGTKPFFFIYGYPYNGNQKLDDQLRLDYKWDVTAQPTNP